MSFSILLYILALGASALSASNAGNGLDGRDVDACKAVKAIITILSQYKAPATSFCSSFLSISDFTVETDQIVCICPSDHERES